MINKPDAPAAVAIEENSIAVADFYNHCIIFQQGDKAITIGKKGHKDGELYYPSSNNPPKSHRFLLP